MNNTSCITSCIFTIIKDEREYIEEFIRYHLNLGIDHIFIFEDTGSVSHKDIVDKISTDRVTLNSIDIFSFDIYKERYKQISKFNPNNNWENKRQFTYQKEGLDWVKNNFNYDWCFAIDCDEYITLEDDSKSLAEILNMYSDYEAIVLSWQNYNANGYINKPDYKKNGGIIQTYTQTCDKTPGDAYWRNAKVVYRIGKFKKNYYRGHHLCSDIHNWVKSDFSKDYNKLIYKNIYIRHYITKSWEEYYWKLNIRGMFHKTNRKLDDFFIMNPDMMNMKEELLEKYTKI